MPDRRAPWQFLPTDVLDLQKRTDQASAWAQEQRRQLAQQWADLHLQDAYDSLGHLLYQSPATQEPPGAPMMPTSAPTPGMPPDQNQAPYPTPDAGSDARPFPAPAPATDYSTPLSGPTPDTQVAQPSAFNTLSQPDQMTAPAVPDPTSGPFAPDPVGRGATAIENQVGQFASDQGQLTDLSRAQFDAARRGESLPPEQDQKLADLSSQYGLVLTGEPLAAVNQAGRAALGLERATNARQPGMSLGPAGPPPPPPPAPGVGAAAIDKTNAMFAEGASHAAQPLTARLGALGTSLTRAVTDAGVDLSNLETDAARTLGRPLRADEMASVQARLNPFYTARVQVDDALRPVLSGVSDADYEAARNALTWRGNVDDAVAKGNPDRAFSGGLSAAESQAALDEQARRLGPQRAAAVDQRVQAVVDFNKAELQRDVAAGLVSREQANTWLQQYPNFTPTVISDYLKEQGRAIGSGKSLNVQGTGYKTKSVEGTARARIDPIAATVDAAYQGEALRRQNTAWRALHDMIQSTPEMANLFQVTKGGYSGATKYENSVSGFIDGERYTITTPFPEIAKAIRQEAGGVNVPGWNTAMALYKELITGRNPTFLVGNAAIDAPIAVLNTAIREGGAQHILPIAVDLFKGYADAFKGVLSGQYTGQATKGYLQGGGGMGFYAAPSATSGAQEVARLRRSSVIDVSSAGDLARLAKDLVTMEWVKGLGERVELGPRAMAYQRALKRGASPEQAVLNGRTVTVDFAQGGTLSKLVNSFVPFFNPAVQGLAQGAKIVRDNPRGALMTLGPALLGPATAVEAWNRADPARSKAYDDVPNYIKDRGVVIMLPGTPPTDANGEPKPQYIVLNMRQYAPLVMAVRETYDRVTGRDGRTAADLLGGAAQQLSPVSSFGQMLPPGITTGAELAANRDLYRRTDIATTRNDERASALAGAAATGINDVLGTRVRPSQADYAIRDLSGGVGDMASSASNILAGKTKESGTPQDIPVIGGFARRLVRGDTGQLLQTARDTRVSPDVQRALVEAGLPPDVSVAPSTYRSIPLLQGEQTVYQQETNKHLEELLGPIVRDPSFKTLPLDAKKKLVQRMVTAAEQMAGAAVIQAIPPNQVNERMGRVIAKKAS